MPVLFIFLYHRHFRHQLILLFDGSLVSIAIIHLCDSVWFYPHGKTKTAETKIAKLGTESPSRYLAYQWILGLKVKGQGHRVKNEKKSRRDSREAPSRSAVTPLNETTPHGWRELCTLSSAQLLVFTLCSKPTFSTNPTHHRQLVPWPHGLSSWTLRVDRL